jgi:hypothetical protein
MSPEATDICVSSERSISIMMDLESSKRELFRFLGENRFVVTGGISLNVYDCFKCTGNETDAIEKQLNALKFNCGVPESEKYAGTFTI